MKLKQWKNKLLSYDTTLAFLLGAGIRCWELMLAELYVREGYRCVERWGKRCSWGRLLSVLHKDLAVLNLLQTCHMKYLRMLDIPSIYYSETDGWAPKRFEVESRICTGLFLQAVRLGQMQIAIIFESSDVGVRLVITSLREVI